MRLWVPTFACLVALTAVAFADNHNDHGRPHAHPANGLMRDSPVEAGQAAFAAIAEIVSILSADPKNRLVSRQYQCAPPTSR